MAALVNHKRFHSSQQCRKHQSSTEIKFQIISVFFLGSLLFPQKSKEIAFFFLGGGAFKVNFYSCTCTMDLFEGLPVYSLYLVYDNCAPALLPEILNNAFEVESAQCKILQ